MIPSDHFVRFYNEVFKAMEARGTECLVAYWRELGRLQTIELGERFRKGGLQAALDYWNRIVIEENCQASLTMHDGWFEFNMSRCPSLSKVLDNDATPSQFYCDHCMGWVEPVMEACGLYAVGDMISRTEPRCRFAVFKDRKQALEFERTAKMPSHPYREAEQRMQKASRREK